MIKEKTACFTKEQTVFMEKNADLYPNEELPVSSGRDNVKATVY